MCGGSLFTQICGHPGGSLVAFTGTVHGAITDDGRQRRMPTGGVAYGIPMKARCESNDSPLTGPLGVTTVEGSDKAYAHARIIAR